MSSPPSKSHPDLLEQREAFAGRLLQVTVDTVRLPNGQQTDLEILRHPGAAAVVPVDRAGNVLMVRQYRYATGGYILEVPAGKLDAGDTPLSCAQRELGEEVGMEAEQIIPMGWIWTTPGFTDERIWLFAATGLRSTQQALEPDEVLTVESVPREDAIRMAREGELTDAKSVCALLRLNHYLPRP